MLGKILSHDDFHEITYSAAVSYYMAGYQPADLTIEDYISDFPDDYFSDDINDGWNFQIYYYPNEFYKQTKRYLAELIKENALTYFFYETEDYNGLLITDGRQEKYVDVADFPSDGTFEDANKWDVSGIEGCKTLKDVARELSATTEDFNWNDFEKLVKIGGNDYERNNEISE